MHKVPIFNLVDRRKTQEAFRGAIKAMIMPVISACLGRSTFVTMNWYASIK